MTYRDYAIYQGEHRRNAKGPGNVQEGSNRLVQACVSCPHKEPMSCQQDLSQKQRGVMTDTTERVPRTRPSFKGCDCYSIQPHNCPASPTLETEARSCVTLLSSHSSK